jgi:hypothetical protein
MGSALPSGQPQAPRTKPLANPWLIVIQCIYTKDTLYRP